MRRERGGACQDQRGWVVLAEGQSRAWSTSEEHSKVSRLKREESKNLKLTSTSSGLGRPGHGACACTPRRAGHKLNLHRTWRRLQMT